RTVARLKRMRPNPPPIRVRQQRRGGKRRRPNQATMRVRQHWRGGKRRQLNRATIRVRQQRRGGTRRQLNQATIRVRQRQPGGKPAIRNRASGLQRQAPRFPPAACRDMCLSLEPGLPDPRRRTASSDNRFADSSPLKKLIPLALPPTEIRDKTEPVSAA